MDSLYGILNGLGIKWTYTYTSEVIRNQEKINSLWGIKKVLEHYGVKVTGVKSEGKSLRDMQYPFVCLGPEGFVVITKEMEDPQAFEKDWNGYALLCDASQAKEPHYKWHKLRDKVSDSIPKVLVAGLVLTVALFIFNPFSIWKTLLVLFNSLGLYFSYRSAVNECSGTCSVVTESPSSKILGYSLSVIGIAYFGISLIPTLFVPSWMPAWNWIAAAALLMPVWSISHQAFVLHAWCRNCLIVQLMVVLSALIVFIRGDFSVESLSARSLVALPTLYLLSAYLLKMAFELYKIVKDPPMDKAILKLMHDPAVRKEILTMGDYVDTSAIPDLWVINPDAENELLLALSLSCGHCREEFGKIYRAYSRGELKDYRIKLVISQKPEDKKVIDVIASVALNENPAKAFELLARWYDERKPKAFLSSEGQGLKMEGVSEVLAHMSSVVRPMNIKGLPYMLLNGHEIDRSVFWAKIELEK
jgi:uncharacterized membrane protein